MTRKKTTKEAVSEFIAIHGDQYDYSEFEHRGIRELSKVICQKHGPFFVTPINHRRGMKCPVCSETFKSKCKRLGVDYHRALKRRQAGLSEKIIFSKGYIRNKRKINEIEVFGTKYPNLKEAVRRLNPPADRKTISRWIANGLPSEEAFEKIPNPGYSNGIIYLVTNLVTQFQYVGLTVQILVRRWKYHVAQAKAGHIKNEKSLHTAIRKYGERNFTIEEIDRGTTKVDLESKERKWIEKLNTLIPNGHNISTGGVSGGSDRKPTTIDEVQFKSVYEAAEYLSVLKGVSISAAKKRISTGNINVKKPANRGESMVGTKIYKAWRGIFDNALNPKSKYYIANIGVIESWREFKNFRNDVGDPPNGDIAFTRLDKKKGYFPNNCAWLTKSDASKLNAKYMKENGLLIGRGKPKNT
ncbi:MAG: GIY-YIG nuclease family protein [Arenicellales bacterium]